MQSLVSIKLNSNLETPCASHTLYETKIWSYKVISFAQEPLSQLYYHVSVGLKPELMFAGRQLTQSTSDLQAELLQALQKGDTATASKLIAQVRSTV